MLTVDNAVAQMCSWKKLADRMGYLWDESQFQFASGESIKQVLIREIKDILSFNIKEILSCETFKKKAKEIYDNIHVLLELNNFENPEWTEEDATLVDDLETFIYQRWKQKRPFECISSFGLFSIL